MHTYSVERAYYRARGTVCGAIRGGLAIVLAPLFNWVYPQPLGHDDDRPYGEGPLESRVYATIPASEWTLAEWEAENEVHEPRPDDG